MPSASGPPWKRWYKTARWRALRLSIFLRDLFTCKKCGHLEGDVSLLVCDHIVPHRGDERLFWDEANLQTLCKRCHDTVKQIEEQDTLHQRGVWH
jgi:5-methylcytosine-specific restriction protein A